MKSQEFLETTTKGPIKAIVCGTLIDGRGGKPVNNAVVLVQGNRITKVGEKGKLKAPPGAGKTTRLPAAILDAGLVSPTEEILVLEPRRIAARLAASRVAVERGSRVNTDLSDNWDFWPYMKLPLDEARKRLNIS